MWWNKNNWVFSQRPTTTQTSLATIMRHVEWILNCNNIIGPYLSFDVGDLHQWHWNPPHIGYLKLNCDESVSNCGRSAGCSGILSDNGGAFIFVFAQWLSCCTVIEVKLWGIYHSLCFAWNKEYKKVIVESPIMWLINLLSTILTWTWTVYSF